MLGKIIKHEFRATWKKICGMYAIMIISLLVAMVSFNLEDIDLTLDYSATQVTFTVNGWTHRLTFYYEF